jgi:hypothetical protein
MKNNKSDDFNSNGQMIQDYVKLLKENKCSIKYKFYEINEEINNETIITKAKHILNTLPNVKYSSILPL